MKTTTQKIIIGSIVTVVPWGLWVIFAECFPFGEKPALWLRASVYAGLLLSMLFTAMHSLLGKNNDGEDDKPDSKEQKRELCSDNTPELTAIISGNSVPPIL